MKLTFTAALTAADTKRRTIAGRVVTWDETGLTSAGPAKFAAGSLTPAEDVVLRLEHDRTRPIGRALSLADGKTGLDAVFSVAATSAGNDALVEAAEGYRNGLSVGVLVVESHVDDDGATVITAGELEEVSLVTHPAIDSARVTEVAASEPEPEEEATEAEPDEETEEEMTEVIDEAVVTEAARPVATVAPRVQLSDFTVGEYVDLSIRASLGEPEALTTISAADQKLADNPGIVPTPIIGELINVIDGARPIINSSRRLPMPGSGKSFQRPIVAQHTTADEQENELDALASQVMKINSLTVTKGTYGGQIRVSFQDRDFTSPAIYGILSQDLSTVYARKTEAVAAADLVAGATGAVAGAAGAAGFRGAVYEASAAVKEATGLMPNVMYVSPDQWQMIGSLADTTGRPLYPNLSPSNADGSLRPTSFEGNPLGLGLVVSSDLPDETIIVGNSRFFETYEQGAVQLSVVDPSVLGVTLAIYGYYTDLVTVGDAFVALTLS